MSGIQRTVLAFVVAATVSACRTAPVAPPPSADSLAPYYPLAVGNLWRYQARMLGETRSFDVEVQRRENGVFYDSTGAQLRLDATGVRDQRRYLLRAPLRVGNSWESVVSVSSVERYRIVATDEVVQVPAGRFDRCVKVESTNRIEDKKLLRNQMWFCPNVGITRISTLLENDGAQLPQTLVELAHYVAKPP